MFINPVMHKISWRKTIPGMALSTVGIHTGVGWYFVAGFAIGIYTVVFVARVTFFTAQSCMHTDKFKI